MIYVVAARAERAGTPPQADAAETPTWLAAGTEPVGMQHATAAQPRPGAPRRALCGQDLTG
jgi:hypothetical protein